MKFCTNCGKELDKDAKFCQNCGNSFKQEGLPEKMDEKATATFNSFKNKNYSKEDLHKVLDNEDRIMEKMNHVKLKGFIDDVKVFFSLLKDFFTGKYKKVPIRTIIIIICTLLYILSPIDIIPDFIPGIGLIDDAAIIGLCLPFIKGDIEEYKIFKKKKNK